jgi:hypothetical protein
LLQFFIYSRNRFYRNTAPPQPLFEYAGIAEANPVISTDIDEKSSGHLLEDFLNDIFVLAILTAISFPQKLFLGADS